MNSFRKLRVRQVEERLRPWRDLDNASPAVGWIRTIRQALGMSAEILAARVGVSRQAIDQFEIGESNQTITLDRLRKLADAMDCDLVYAIVPRKNLSALIEEQAHRQARKHVQKVSHSMTLEDQGVSNEETQALIEDTAKAILNGPSSALWSTSDHGESKRTSNVARRT